MPGIPPHGSTATVHGNKSQTRYQTAVAFLTTRVKSPDEDDWGKLKRVLKYLNGTKYLKLRLTVDNLSVLKWYVDGLQR